MQSTQKLRFVHPISDFPEAPWQAVRAADPGMLEELLPGFLDDLMLHRGAARDPDLVREHLTQHPVRGRILLHGAGTHSAWLLGLLEELCLDARVVGVIDKLAETFDDFNGHQVVTPIQAAACECDVVLLSNVIWEQQMRTALEAAGIPPDKIRGIYSDPRYRSLAAQSYEQDVDDLPEVEAEFVLIDFARPNQYVVSDEMLETVLPPERTLRLYSERFPGCGDSSSFRSVGFRNSLDLLRELLQRLRPRVLYLRTFSEDNLAAALVRRFLPRVRLLHEVYDWAVTIDPGFLKEVHGHTDDSIQAAMTGELYTLRHSDFVITKRGGAEWSRVTSESRTEHASFFPQLLPAVPGSRAESADVAGPRTAPLRLIYAGNLPRPNSLDIDMVGGLFPLFDAVTRAGDASIRVFNGVHRSTAEDEQFSFYMAFAKGGIDYQRALPYASLVEEMRQSDYGWLYFPRDGIDFADELVLISNKFTAYVSAGLPVIIDDGWGYMAELVRTFDAGIVHPMRSPDSLLDRLQTAHQETHRRGVLALSEHLLLNNDRVLQRLRSWAAQT